MGSDGVGHCRMGARRDLDRSSAVTGGKARLIRRQTSPPTSTSMSMPVMHIGKMLVRMRDRRMHVAMRMRFIAFVRKIVLVPMMFVVHMRMRVLYPVVR